MVNTSFFASKIYNLRTDNGITQQQLADAIGVNVRTIIRIEKGEQIPSILSAMRLAEYFSLTVEQLFPTNNKQ